MNDGRHRRPHRLDHFNRKPGRLRHRHQVNPLESLASADSGDGRCRFHRFPRRRRIRRRGSRGRQSSTTSAPATKPISTAAAEVHRVDLRDQAAVEKAVASFRPEIVNHHAAQSEVPKSVADPGFDAQVNIVGGLNLLEGKRRPQGKKGHLHLDRRGAVRRAGRGARGRETIRCGRCPRTAPASSASSSTSAPSSARSDSSSRCCATRTSTGRARTSTPRRAGWWRSSPAGCSRENRSPSTATASSRATCSTSATRPPPTWPRSSAAMARSFTSAPACRSRSTISSASWPCSPDYKLRAELRAAAKGRRLPHRSRQLEGARGDLGWEPRVSLEEGLSLTVDYFREQVSQAPA